MARVPATNARAATRLGREENLALTPPSPGRPTTLIHPPQGAWCDPNGSPL